MIAAEPYVETLTYDGVLDARSLLVFLAAHQVKGLDHTDLEASTHTRVVPTGDGSSLITITFRQPGCVEFAALGGAEDRHEITAHVRRWLSLDANIPAIEHHLEQSPLLRPLIERRRGLRFLGSMNPFESAVMTILGQHVSLAAARQFGSRLVAAYGTQIAEDMTAFPTPAHIAKAHSDDLQRTIGITRARARTVAEVARAVADDEIMLHSDAEPQVLAEQLLSIPGIGPWTADYIAIRVLGDLDAFLGGDLVLRKALGAKTAKEAEAIAEKWRPYRAYAMLHLWTEEALSGA